ncbi:MAG: TVP38/TMEM64 family protein [candidate division NC10 bacterium]|nr:TVP38/TMEM64 family protein [candidate division NC10 bacterium]
MAGGLAAFLILGGNRAFNLANLKAHRETLLLYVQDHRAFMLIAAMVIYTASIALSLPIALLLSLATGFLFGRWVGTAIIVCSATLGATLAFLAARYLFAEAARRRMGHLAERLVAGFHQNDFYYLLSLRLIPLFPFWLINLAPAFTPIKVRTYMAATALGILPASFIFANLGGSLGEVESADQLLSAQSITALALLAAFALVPVLIKRLRGGGRHGGAN